MRRATGMQTASLYSSAGQRKYLTADERRRFLEAANATPHPKLRTLCLVLAYTGCRISEALSLTPRSIERAGGFIAIRSLKKRNRILVREVPVPNHLLDTICEAHAGCDPAARLWTWCRSRAWQLVKEVMRQAGIEGGPHATPKGLRHGFGLHAIASDVTLNLVQRWLGHARMETTAIYLQAMGAEEREIAARMWTANEQRISRR